MPLGSRGEEMNAPQAEANTHAVALTGVNAPCTEFYVERQDLASCEEENKLLRVDRQAKLVLENGVLVVLCKKRILVVLISLFVGTILLFGYTGVSVQTFEQSVKDYKVGNLKRNSEQNISTHVRQCLADYPIEWADFSNKFFKPQSWAFNLFIHGSEAVTSADETKKVMYQAMPKAGSSALRFIMGKEYGYLGKDGKPWYNSGSRPDCETKILSKSIAYQYHDWYKFTFVVDPFDHLLGGVVQVYFKNSLPKWHRSDGVKGVPNRFVRDLSAKLLSVATVLDQVARTGRCSNCEIWRRYFNIHLTPQSWHLRNSAHVGAKLDFIGRLGNEDFSRLITDLKAKGFHAPNNITELERGGRMRLGFDVLHPDSKKKAAFSEAANSNSYSFRDLKILIPSEIQGKVCDLLAVEYECLGFDKAACRNGTGRGE